MFQKMIFFLNSFPFLLNAWLHFNVRPTPASAYLGSDAVMVQREQKEEKICWNIRGQVKILLRWKGWKGSLFFTWWNIYLMTLGVGVYRDNQVVL